jgi:hypothetical protein
VTVAAIGEIAGLGRALPDHRALAAIRLVTGIAAATLNSAIAVS